MAKAKNDNEDFRDEELQEITGKYETEDNITRIYADNTIYTYDEKTDDLSSVKVGNPMEDGTILTQEMYDDMEAKCTQEGSFDLDLSGQDEDGGESVDNNTDNAALSDIESDDGDDYFDPVE